MLKISVESASPVLPPQLHNVPELAERYRDCSYAYVRIVIHQRLAAHLIERWSLEQHGLDRDAFNLKVEKLVNKVLGEKNDKDATIDSGNPSPATEGRVVAKVKNEA